jgi:hypothetical protein
MSIGRKHPSHVGGMLAGGSGNGWLVVPFDNFRVTSQVI